MMRMAVLLLVAPGRATRAPIVDNVLYQKFVGARDEAATAAGYTQLQGARVCALSVDYAVRTAKSNIGILCMFQNFKPSHLYDHDINWQRQIFGLATTTTPTFKRAGQALAGLIPPGYMLCDVACAIDATIVEDEDDNWGEDDITSSAIFWDKLIVSLMSLGVLKSTLAIIKFGRVAILSPLQAGTHIPGRHTSPCGLPFWMSGAIAIINFYAAMYMIGTPPSRPIRSVVVEFWIKFCELPTSAPAPVATG